MLVGTSHQRRALQSRVGQEVGIFGETPANFRQRRLGVLKILILPRKFPAPDFVFERKFSAKNLLTRPTGLNLARRLHYQTVGNIELNAHSFFLLYYTAILLYFISALLVCV